jgi:hypothetical protein
MAQDLPPAGHIRIGHRERDAVAAVLQEAAGDGRLSMAELDDRLEAALQAKTSPIWIHWWPIFPLNFRRER